MSVTFRIGCIALLVFASPFAGMTCWSPSPAI
jgi:hypothetical protein